MEELLKVLEKDCTLTTAQIATMLGMTEGHVASEIKRLESERVILGYRAVVDRDKTEGQTCSALIEVKVTPSRGEGFDRVAERIFQYNAVESVFLMSGGHDLTVVISGRTMKEVALFVAQKLATIEGVTATATHFILKKYKENGVVFTTPEPQEERILMV